MVGLLIITHGRLAEELVATAEQIVGKLENVAHCEIDPSKPLSAFKDDIEEAIQTVGQQGALAMVDLIGGTPCNQSLMLCERGNLEVVTGANLPLLLKAHSLRTENMGLSEMAETLAQHGRENIIWASGRLRANMAQGKKP